MKKILFALLLVSTQAFGGTSYTGSMEIIPPEVATAHRSFYSSALDSRGNLLVCPFSDWYERGGTCQDEKKQNKWAHLKDIVPAGKTYAGYSINSNNGTIYVYWK